METLWHDLRYGLRMLVKNPGFTTVAVIVLALGIGANTAIFSAVNAVLLRSLPYHDPDQLVVPASTNYGRGSDRVNVSYGDFADWKREQVFAHVAVFQTFTYDLTGTGEPDRAQASAVSADYFAVMGAAPLLGRALLPEEHKPGGTRVAVLSHGLWQRRFGSDPHLIGQTIKLNGAPFTVVGVMPPSSTYPDSVELWVPMAFSEDNPPQDLLRRDNFIWQAVARLKPGVSVEQTQTHLQTIAQRIERDHPVVRKGWSVRLVPLQEWIVGTQLRQALLVLLGAVGFVLLIGCANVANLLLARAAVRQREMAIRMSLGAGRLRLVRQLFTESLLLACLGGIAGLLLAKWGARLLITFAPSNIPRLNEMGMDSLVLGFVLGVSAFTAVVFGIVPSLQATKTNLSESLKEGGRSATGGLRSGRTRSLLVVAEVALSLVLLIGAGLMIRSFIRLQQVDPGFKVDHLLTLDLNAPRSRYRDNPQVLSFYQGLTDRLKALPGVQAACVSSALPLGGGGFYLGRVFLIEGHPEPPAGPDFSAQWDVISPDYFSTLGVGLLKGRFFSERDTAESTPVIIINETMARRMFPNENPLGKRIRSWRDENLLREIVGVVRDVRYFGRDDQLRGLVYIPHTQNTWRSMTLTVRTAGDPTGMVEAVRNGVWAADKDLAIANIRTMQRIMDDSVARQRFSMLLLSLFAIVALMLAAVGIYGVMSYAVAQRTHEIGVRMALGAERRDILRLVVGRGLALVVAGVGLGLTGAFALTRLMSNLLFAVSARDPMTFAALPLLLAVVALIACYLPARRATKVDPMIALRYE
jgi:putative ABC transport system permease protein